MRIFHLCLLFGLLSSFAPGGLLDAQGAGKGEKKKGGGMAGMPKEFDYHYFQTLYPAVGEPAAPMHAKDPDGNEVDLKQFLGRWVMIEFGSYT